MSTLPATWLEYVQDQSRRIKQPPNPTKRHQPKIKRMVSPRQRAALSQSRNFVRAAYNEDFMPTPTKPESWKGERPNLTDWSTGKATVERRP